MADEPSLTELFVHRNRPEWGLAICTESRQNKTDFLFQDGTTRTFRDDFLHLMTPADRPRDVTERVVNRLRMQANGLTAAAPSLSSTAPAVPTVDDQVKLFRHLFPGGFEDASFIAKHRGEPEMRRRKGHHGLAAADAQEVLGAEALATALEAGAQDAIVTEACRVLESTSLAPKAAVATLRSRAGSVGFAEQLFSTLHNQDVTEFDRYTRWLMVLEAALGAPAGWEIATALPALVHPGEHLAVKRAPFQRIAAELAPNLTLAKAPNAELYRRVRGMSQDLLTALKKRGETPRDLLDVTAFVRIVMRPKNVEMLEGLA